MALSVGRCVAAPSPAPLSLGRLQVAAAQLSRIEAEATFAVFDVGGRGHLGRVIEERLSPEGKALAVPQDGVQQHQEIDNPKVVGSNPTPVTNF